MTEAISGALTFLGTGLIPALFPFLLAGQLLAAPPVFLRLLRLSARFARFLRLPPVLPVLLLCALTGGYPAGALILRRCTETRLLSQKAASLDLMLLCFPSPALVLTLTGRILLRSPEIGRLLYMALLLAALPLALLVFLLNKKARPLHRDPPAPLAEEAFHPAAVLTKAIQSTGEILLSICFAVLAAACLQPLISALPGLPKPVAALLSAMTEIGSGLPLLAKTPAGGRLFHLAFALSFGGLGVFAQLAAVLQDSGIRLRYFLLTRPVFALLTALFFRLLLSLFSPSAPAASVPPAVLPFSAPPLAGCFLLAMLAYVLAFFSGARPEGAPKKTPPERKRR